MSESVGKWLIGGKQYEHSSGETNPKPHNFL